MEDSIILDGQKEIGNQWKQISQRIKHKRRTATACKLRWHCLQRQAEISKREALNTNNIDFDLNISLDLVTDSDSMTESDSAYGNNGTIEAEMEMEENDNFLDLALESGVISDMNWNEEEQEF